MLSPMLRVPRVLALLLLIATHAPAGCGGGASEAPELRGVLLVSIDTLRPDHLGAYGYGRTTSPHFDALARDGVLFEQALSVAPWTLPAHATLLTGLLPHRHGVRSGAERLSAGADTLAARLGAAGFRSAAIVNSIYVGRHHGLDGGFDTFQELPEPGRAPSAVAEHALAWLEAHRRDPAPFFLFLHLYDPHSDYHALPRYEREFARPYHGPVDGTTAQLRRVMRGELALGPPDRERLVDLYDAGVRQTDVELGRVLGWLDAHGLRSRVLVVVTSDHGEEFLERGGVLHARTHYEELLRIPLVIGGPGVPAGRRIPRPVSLVDVAPTILGLAGVADPATDGHDLAALWRGRGSADEERFLVADGSHGEGRPGALRSLRGERWKLIHDRETDRVELYDLAADPGEQDDLSARRPELRDALLARLEAATAPTGEGAVRAEAAEALSPEEAERLRALGYVVSP